MSQTDIYQSVTDRIIQALESGTAPWVRPWKSDRTGGALPHNAVTGRSYHGINVALLWAEETAKAYPASAWLTFKQAQELGGTVRKGEKGTAIVFWKFRDVKDSESGEIRKIPMLRTYYVFNVAQCDDLKMPKRRGLGAPIAETDIDAMLASSEADIRHGGDRACYIPSRDQILMPKREAFRTLHDYHGTLLHELTHWTSHETRCNRELGKRFGDRAYAAEELIAEIGSAFLCAALNVPHESLQHADYLAHWLEILREDNRAIFTASKQAQVACDFILAACGVGEDSAELAEAA
jgi:antirestriction protein ArdC